MMTTIVELSGYIKDAERVLDMESQNSIKDFLAINPKAGDLIQGTGGVRKLRWARTGSGKSGGLRVIYYYHNEAIPLFLLSIFGKNEKSNLNKFERNALNKLTTILVKTYGAKGI